MLYRSFMHYVLLARLVVPLFATSQPAAAQPATPAPATPVNPPDRTSSTLTFIPN